MFHVKHSNGRKSRRTIDKEGGKRYNKGTVFSENGKEIRMAKIIAFANQKGGVGKTTSAINVAASLGILGKKVLLIDLDPQGNCSSGVGIDKANLKLSVYDVLMERAKAEEVIIKTKFENLWVLPSEVALAGAEIELADSPHRQNSLKCAILPLEDQFDYILMDCPPSLGLLTLNGLVASKEIIVPMQCEFFALEGLSQLMVTVDLVRKHYNPALSLGGVILTMYDGRLNLSLAVATELKKYFADRIFRNTVPRNVRLSEAPSHGKPVYYYDKNSKGAQSYLAIAQELEKRN